MEVPVRVRGKGRVLLLPPVQGADYSELFLGSLREFEVEDDSVGLGENRADEGGAHSENEQKGGE